MILYELDVGGDDTDGSARGSLYFTSLAAALQERAKRLREYREELAAYNAEPEHDLYDAPPESPHGKFAIERVTVVDLPKQQLALLLLNGHWQVSSEQVVPPYTDEEL